MKRSTPSLVELVVAVVILGVLAALAIPHFSHAAVSDDAGDLRTDLAVLRTAIEMYYDDHGFYPAQRSAGTAGAGLGTAAAFIRQLTQYTDAEGHARATPGEPFGYGPYLRDGVPPCPVSVGRPSAAVHVIAGMTGPAYDPTAPHAGWVYNYETGYIAANSPAQDPLGVRYDSY